VDIGRGTLALVGPGEFLPAMRTVETELLRRSGGQRVAILPMASAPDGPQVAKPWAEMGAAHFAALGAVMALDAEAPPHVKGVRRADWRGRPK